MESGLAAVWHDGLAQLPRVNRSTGAQDLQQGVAPALRFLAAARFGGGVVAGHFAPHFRCFTVSA